MKKSEKYMLLFVVVVLVILVIGGIILFVINPFKASPKTYGCDEIKDQVDLCWEKREPTSSEIIDLGKPLLNMLIHVKNWMIQIIIGNIFKVIN